MKPGIFVLSINSRSDYIITGVIVFKSSILPYCMFIEDSSQLSIVQWQTTIFILEPSSSKNISNIDKKHLLNEIDTTLYMNYFCSGDTGSKQYIRYYGNLLNYSGYSIKRKGLKQSLYSKIEQLCREGIGFMGEVMVSLMTELIVIYLLSPVNKQYVIIYFVISVCIHIFCKVNANSEK